MPSRVSSCVFWMETTLACCTPWVKDRPCSAGNAVHSIVCTLTRAGKFSVDRIVMLVSEKESPMMAKLSPDSEVICVTLSAIKLPVILWMPSRAMLSVVPVAMAMLPVNV